ncbi:glycine N-methyltransferase-like [Watersipora subatra]|uniref:glycine N-methyltransferase-like n=1 Tax=Watersipora subatra TaxID=2589382 RepID=UPI00355C4D0C
MSANVDSVFRTRSLGVPSTGLPDQYADGRAAKVWELYMGGKSARTDVYKEWFAQIFKEKGVKSIIDVACGTGIDSIMLLEEGFKVVSCDASDKMLKSALEERWKRRKEPAFDQWVIREANWLTLDEDIAEIDNDELPEKQFDAVICCGNSFAHLPDFQGGLGKHKVAIQQFYNLLKPGGILVIDHRNYDQILESGTVPHGPNVYYQGGFIKDIKTSNLYVNGKPTLVTLDYEMDIHNVDEEILNKLKIDPHEQVCWKFRLSFFPHRLSGFTDLLQDIFGKDAEHEVFADFQPLSKCEKVPAYYMHVIRRPDDS